MRFTIKARLAISFATVLLLTAIVTYIAILNLQLLNDIQDSLVSGQVTETRLVLEIGNELSNLENLEKDIIIETDKEKLNHIIAAIKKQQGHLKTLIKEWGKMADVEEKKKIDEFVSILNELRTSQEEEFRLAMLHSVATAKALRPWKGE